MVEFSWPIGWGRDVALEMLEDVNGDEVGDPVQGTGVGRESD